MFEPQLDVLAEELLPLRLGHAGVGCPIEHVFSFLKEEGRAPGEVVGLTGTIGHVATVRHSPNSIRSASRR